MKALDWTALALSVSGAIASALAKNMTALCWCVVAICQSSRLLMHDYEVR